MNLDIWLLPVLATVVAVYSAQLDPDDPKHPKRIKVLIALLVGGCVVQIYFGYQKEADNKAILKEEKSTRRDIQNNLSEALRQLSKAGNERDQLYGLVELVNTTVTESKNYIEKYLVKVGASAQTINNIDESAVAASLLADKALKKRRRQGTSPTSTVWYFRKKLDEDLNPNKFIHVLKILGFKVVEKEPNVTSKRINAIFYGKDVPEDDVRTVALALLRAGVKLRWFAHTTSDAKRNIIQLGATAIEPYTSYRPWTVQEIEEASSLGGAGNPETSKSQEG